MRLACLLIVVAILAFAAHRKLRDHLALKTADIFTGAYMAGWGDALATAAGVLDDCEDDDVKGQVNGVHYHAQVKAAREGRQ